MKWTHSLALFAACALLASGCVPVTPEPTPTPEPVDQFEVVRARLDTWLSADPPAATTAANVFELINDESDPYVVSARSAEHYAIGHVPGAVNIPWKSTGNEGATDDLPMDETIYVYCYTGHTGGVAAACLNAMGYNAVNMKYGMCAWTPNADVRATTCFDEETSADYPVSTVDVPGEANNDLPTLDVTDSEDEDEIVRAAVENYLANEESPIITAEAVFERIVDGEELFLVSVRGPDDYAKGHIEGAINIPWKQIAKAENLRKLPTDRQIIVYCYTGHSGALATTALNLLGYDAVNLKFGLVAWTKDAEVRATSAFSEADVNNFPVEPPIEE